MNILTKMIIVAAAVVAAACSNTNENLKEVTSFPLTAVKLLDGPFKDATELNERILLAYEPDRFLARFRKNAGLEPKAEHYGGWEAQSLAGHSLGHYLSACALMYLSTGNEEFRIRANYIVDELALCQEADGDGYLGAFDNGKEVFENEIAKGDIRSQGFDLNGIWAPFYTHHKVLAGLHDAYTLLDNEKALTVATRFADWIGTVIEPLTDEQMQQVLHCEHGGMNESLVDLYNHTQDKKYLDMAGAFYHKAVLDNLVQGRDSLAGLHANTQIPKVIGLVKRYQATGNEEDYQAAKFFWDRVVHHHSYVTGGNANHEYFGQPDKLSKRLSDETTETCNVYNMLKLSDRIFQWEPSAEVADYYERALFNQILASQHPLTGHVIYNLSLEMGGHKHYQNPFGFTCCVGTGMENHAKYAGHIYYHNDDELYITQYMASELSWEDKGLTLRQETAYPQQQGTAFTFNLEESQRFDVKIRYPYWAEQGITIRVNGEEYQHGETPGSFVTLSRTWKDGDHVEVELPFTLRTEEMPDDHTRLAVLYGPVVMAGELGEVDDPKAKDSDFVPVFFTEDRNPKAWIETADGPNTFSTQGVGKPRDVEMKPFYVTHDKRYSVYWDVFNQQEWKELQATYEAEKTAYARIESITYDFFQLGEMQPERDHHYEGGDAHVVQMQDRKARQAERGGWFGFDMKVLPAQPMALVFEYWGGYTGSKTFDIQVDGQTIATQNISGIKDGSFLSIQYDIPEDLTKDKQHINVKIAPHTGSRGGPLFAARTVKR
ncbi:glycoside hydrolase family 127 protein [Parapedobacter tibetensis]|uniref:glycoside hydrolase family 127 protein n=1 Tax=Parapedobacter tibetensis TaxID=2972951 RepID=UPI00214DA07E|nr:glycoside hydrolase family 127 protein [Parapedobacter tibetensis]